MLSSPPIERLALPPAPQEPARVGFPVAASIAPVVLSLGVWAVTGSPYSLLFAALGPVVAIGSLLDGRRQRHRAGRKDRQRALTAIARLAERVDGLNTRERERLDRLGPPIDNLIDPRRVLEHWAGGLAPLGSPSDASFRPVRVGRAEIPSAVELTGEPDEDGPAVLQEAIAELRRAGSRMADAPWLADAFGGIGILGPPIAARAVARSLTIQLLAQLSPSSTELAAPSAESWVIALPHRVAHSADHSFRVHTGTRNAVIAWGRDVDDLPPGIGTILRLDSDDRGDVRDPVFLGIGSSAADDAARALASIARDNGVASVTGLLPESVALAKLLLEPAQPDEPHPQEGGRVLAVRSGGDDVGVLRAPVGIGSEGVVELDLVRDGPHAVVSGTTGTGKSELLVSWVLAMATRHSPRDVTFLLIDFKGGAAFAPLAGVPHVVGIVSDLDARRSRRAIESLRAELRRRERLLAERGARSIDELRGELARLVIVVDEFAAVVSGQPELHEVFADLAARGRSLGLHLVLCTQRPSGVIRDGVLANVTLRISLRVTDRGDSAAMIGSDAAFALPPSPRGRAVIADGSGAVREVQLALAEPSDAARLRAAADATPAVMWCDPLPELIRLDELRAQPDVDGIAGILFGRLDLPTEQRQPLAVHDPFVDGHLLVLGAARAGRTTTLATFAADSRCRVLPSEPADAWSVLDELSGQLHDSAASIVLLIDDLDVLIDRFDPDARHEVVERLTRLARESRRLGLIVSAQRLTGPLQRLAGLFDARLLLRQPNRDEHVLAGGDGASFDPTLPPGGGTWRGAASSDVRVQVAFGSQPLPPAERPELPRVRPGPGAPLAIVAERPRELEHRMAVAGAFRVIRVGEEPAPVDVELAITGSESLVLLGDSDAWQAEWALLARVRREFPLVFFGCTAVEIRAIARIRESPPPLGSRPGECWLVTGGGNGDGGIRRAILEL